MAKSLTETAKAILMKEGAIPSVSSSDNDPDRDAKSTTPSKSSLRPNAKGGEMAPMANPGSNPPKGETQDLGPALTKQGDVPPSAKASGKVAKDTSGSSQSRGGTGPGETAPVKTPGSKTTEAEIMEEDEMQEEIARIVAEARARKKKEDEEELEEEENLEEAKKSEKDEEEDEEEDEDSSESKKDMNEEEELEEEIQAFIDTMIEEGATDEEIEEALAEALSSDEEYDVDMSEHVDALFHGEELSEEFKAKALTIFEAAVRQKVEEEIALLEQAFAETLEEEVASIQEELSSNVDDYLNYVVEQWVSENEVAIEAGLRTELTEDFISGLKTLFAEHYIDLPEDKVSVVEELGSKVAELEDKLNEEIERSVALSKQLNESKKFEVIASATDGLTSTQAEKLKALAEGVEFTDVEEFSAKIKTIRENYFPTGTVKSSNALDKAESSEDGKGMIAEEVKGPMAAYVKALGKKLPN